jgi:peroxiredoxin
MKIGDEVPDFTLETGPGDRRHLSELCAGPTVLIFLRHLA